MTAPHEDYPVEQALTGGTLQAVGWYRFYFGDERWEWSAEVAQIHGYRPGTVTPTTQLVLSHKHPDDYKYIAATLDDIRRTHKPLSTRHRIITVQGQTRDIVIIGERLHDDTGEVIGTQGFYLDVTPTNEERQESISQALIEIAENRASIEQAKGVLIYIYGIGPAAAFDLLNGDPRKATSNCVRSPSKCWPTSSHSSTTRALPYHAQHSTSCSLQPTNAWPQITLNPFRLRLGIR